MWPTHHSPSWAGVWEKHCMAIYMGRGLGFLLLTASNQSMIGFQAAQIQLDVGVVSEVS